MAHQETDDLKNLTWLTTGTPKPMLNPVSTTAKTAGFGTGIPGFSIDYRLVPVKPPISYAQLIVAAIQSFETQRARLSEIVQWVRENFVYFSVTNDGSWKRSLRYNLHINKRFIEEYSDDTMDSYWRLNAACHKSGKASSDRSQRPPQRTLKKRSSNPDIQSAKLGINPVVQRYLRSYTHHHHTLLDHSYTRPISLDLDSAPSPTTTLISPYRSATVEDTLGQGLPSLDTITLGSNSAAWQPCSSEEHVYHPTTDISHSTMLCVDSLPLPVEPWSGGDEPGFHDFFYELGSAF